EESSVDAELASAQRDMLVVLKLQKRLSGQTTSAAVKVATFDREKGQQSLKPTDERLPMPIAEIAARLRDPSQGAVATIDGDGSLLLSTDRQRIDRLFGWDGQRYQLERREDQWVLATRLADGRVLRGYLADNPEKPARPLAKFSIEDSSARGAKPKPAAKVSDAAASAN
ncbi:MAG: hypothetical protein L0211_25900, partial [Planctomycetaceae bacterium]|nr:hypothetical protein [Planctomycetaceae bacterium]